MALSPATRRATVPATTKVRGVALIVLGSGLALAMASFTAMGGFQPIVLVVFASILLAGVAAVFAGVALFRRGVLSTVHKGFLIGAAVLIVVTALVLNNQLGSR